MVIRFYASKIRNFWQIPVVIAKMLKFAVHFFTIMRVRHQTDNVEEIVAATIEAMEAVKGKDIVTLDLREITTAVTDYFVICHAPSKTQVDAIADKVEEVVFEKTHNKPYHVEGRENTEWILIDFVDVVVHVFLESKREFYKLEELWADAERIVKATEE